MALYLGNEKLGVTITRGKSDINYASGTAKANSSGVIVFPELSFTPKMIAVWNVVQRDLKAEAEADGNEWEEGWVRYVHSGIMLFAVYQDETWVSQGLAADSAGVFISSETYAAGSTVNFSNNQYSYRILRSPEQTPEYDGETFNYAIYG